MISGVSTHTYNIGHMRIKHYKNNPIFAQTSSTTGITSTENNAISDLSTNAVNVVLFCSTGLLSTLANSMDTAKANVYPFYLLVYFYHFIYPPVMFGTLSLIYYLRHPPLRNYIYRELRNYYDSIIFQWTCPNFDIGDHYVLILLFSFGVSVAN